MGRLVLLLPTFLIPASTYLLCSFLDPGVPDPAQYFGEAMSWTEAGFQLGTGWLGGKMNSLMFGAGHDPVYCSLCPHSGSTRAEVRGEAVKWVTGTKRDKQKIIFQATIHHLKLKKRNNFPASTALNRWTKPLQWQAGLSGLRKPISPRPQGDYPGWLRCFQAQADKSFAVATACIDLFICTEGQ